MNKKLGIVQQAFTKHLLHPPKSIPCSGRSFDPQMTLNEYLSKGREMINPFPKQKETFQ